MNENKILEHLIETAYRHATYCEDVDFGVLEPLDPTHAFRYFHLDKVFLVERNDDYFCGIRASHFTVEIGWTEIDPLRKTQEDRAHIYCIVTANHKGTRRSMMFNLD